MKVNYSLFKQVFSRVLLLGFTLVAFVVLSALCAVLLPFGASAQDGEAGIRAAADQVGGYFDTGCDLVYAIGAVVGLIGAVKVFNKWNAGEPDTNKVAAAWFGSCIFLVIVATVLKSFFGV
ncbi:protein of unknown function [Pedobacter steynii]|uniref:DUF4134 domain-containing protein n=1 Tax=Pedobacter steynii TaxID=430522 RepID=A0A1G9K5D1_9SPHI|nr:DUF4134 domain-containing protein [Pedobacter steynii]NQX38445.1 DUF4134 domain-containing protein [Pedobacter steynii]SDL44624.1 protein of unknown function [Pedobacter steynii]